MSGQFTHTYAARRAAGWHLTPRQQEILSAVASGLGDKQIALALGVSVHTVRSHLDRVFQAHGLHNRSSAVAAWITSSRQRASDA
jgi:DNA-binding NarL/FixJ family response regulator